MSDYVLAGVDEARLLAQIEECTRRQRVRVERAATQEELLAKVARRPPALIVLDLSSHSLAPLLTIRRLKADGACQKIPVVGFFSQVHIDLGNEAKEAGCDHVIMRSAFIHQLPSILRQFIGR